MFECVIITKYLHCPYLSHAVRYYVIILVLLAFNWWSRLIDHSNNNKGFGYIGKSRPNKMFEIIYARRTKNKKKPRVISSVRYGQRNTCWFGFFISEFKRILNVDKNKHRIPFWHRRTKNQGHFHNILTINSFDTCSAMFAIPVWSVQTRRFLITHFVTVFALRMSNKSLN